MIPMIPRISQPSSEVKKGFRAEDAIVQEKRRREEPWVRDRRVCVRSVQWGRPDEPGSAENRSGRECRRHRLIERWGRKRGGREIRERGIPVFAKKIKRIVINFIYRLFIEETQGLGIVLTRTIRRKALDRRF